VLSASHPELSVGCHIVLVDGTPSLKAERIFSLIDREAGRPDRFRHHLGSFAVRALAGRLDPDELEAEATAQLRSLQTNGIALTHFDTHKHTHIFPCVLRPLLRAAKACGIGAVRNPFGPRLPFSWRDLGQRPNLWKRFFEMRVLSAFARSFRGMIAEFGMRTPDGSFGVISTGAVDLELFQVIVNSIPDGTWEFICHPGYNDPDLATIRTRLRESREIELRLLTSAAAREALKARGIQLISYREL
jgi:predicted glycoside hydrolase/deacetylase ChbG (UPF0249 family)